MGADTDDLPDDVKARLKAKVAALPPLTDTQLDALADTLAVIRLRTAGQP
jgi:hypothetical protein